MAVSENAKAFITHQCNEHGRTTDDVARRWSNTYPDDTFTVAEANAVLGLKPAKKSKKAKKAAKK